MIIETKAVAEVQNREQPQEVTALTPLPFIQTTRGISVCLIVGIIQRASVKSGTQLGQDNHKQT
jgi:hypothetical protein